MNRCSDNLDHTSHLSLTESTIMTGEPASAGRDEDGGSEMEAVQKTGGGRRRETTRRSRPWCLSPCACPSSTSTPARPIIIPRPPPLSLSPSLCPPSVARVGIHLSAITGLDDNAAISGRPSFARPPSASAASIATRTSEEFAALTTSGPIRSLSLRPLQVNGF